MDQINYVDKINYIDEFGNKDHVIFLCEHCGPKVGRFSHLDPNLFVGCEVYRLFTNGDWREHMWVHVTGVKDGYLTGKLKNSPWNAMDLKRGDDVTVTMDQIEDVNFLNADISKKQKRKLAKDYIKINSH